jgi:hypothetical protein
MAQIVLTESLSTRAKEVWDVLKSQTKVSFKLPILHDVLDTSLEEPGVYAIWNAERLLYLGIATKSRPAGLSKALLRGLKDRLESHRRGQISGSSLAIALWFKQLAPSVNHELIVKHEINPSAMTEEYIRNHLSYTCLPTLDARRIETELCQAFQPPLNEFQSYLKNDGRQRRRLA